MATSSHAEPVRIVDETPDVPSLFENATRGTFREHIAICGLKRAVRRFGGEATVEAFVEGVLEADWRGYHVDEARLVEDGSSLAMSDDVVAPVLLALPDETLLFVGADPTSTARTFPLFAFTVERTAPVPTPTTAEEALDLLKPGAVREALDDREVVSRQGEWFLVATDRVPVGGTWSPGREGASPLGNHVPTEYGFAVDESLFVERFHEAVPSAPSSLKSVPEILETVRKWDNSTLDRPGYELVQEIGDTVFVRGSVRHRHRDHGNLDAGGRWREAHTHDVDVYTADDVDGDFRVMLD